MIKVDFQMYATAIKNMIDNGIKYSKDKKVTITNSKNSIKISNNATALNYPLEKYFEPSFDENSNKLSLGIYITNYILKANLYRLSYEHVEGKNIFMIVPCTGC